MRRWLPLLCVALLPLGGCVTAALNGTADGGAAQRAHPDLVDDARITHEVRNLLYRDLLVGDRRIQVSAERGIVTLRGTVTSRMEVMRATEIAESVEGVQGVRLQLVINDRP